jgi:CBS domain-containing protein
MNTKIADLMTSPVMTTTPHQTMGHVKKVLRENSASCMPVVNTEGEPVGIITSSDLLEEFPDGSPVSRHMTEKVYTVPQYNDVSIAARIMRNHHIHHVVVTHEKKVVGIISSWDLLSLVENHRFVMKSPPTENGKKGGRRGRQESFFRPD